MMIYRPPEDQTPDVPCPMLKEPFDREDLEVDKPISQENFQLAPVPGRVAYLQKNKRLTPESHWQDVREITLMIGGNVRYKPGDTLIVYPQNFPEDVQALIDLMDWATVADVPLQFKRDPGTDFYDMFHVKPSPTNFYPRYNSTLRQLLTLNLDITAIPQRKVLDLLACYTIDPTHKERLLELSNPAFTDEFFDYATRPRRSILEVLQDFSSVKLPFQIVTTVFPTIRGRPYSISSGGKQLVTYNNSVCTRVQLLVAIVHYKTVLQKVRRGLCTRWLAALQEERSMIMVDFNPTDLYLDIQMASRQPLIMIAPGTGLAPCRSLIWDRAEIANDYPVSPIYLFFGGRNEKADYFYENEWKDLTHLLHVVTAFSRDDPTGRKVYVQERIREHGEMIFELLFECAAVIIVCGSSGSMPNAVREAFVDVVEEHHPTKPDRAGASALLARLEDIGRYKQETW
ncbi:uncharacterized protein L3040_006268 [Drepanopeziza brunnea f. sp. 'multigermtubi']|nr:hypothetical protein L3040_006268 [Drepanopeziza brunnea f. sp. 'multigermtubi']